MNFYFSRRVDMKNGCVQRYLNTARSLCKVQVPRFALRNWAPLSSRRFLSAEAVEAVEEQDDAEDEYDMFDEAYMSEKDKAYIKKLEQSVGNIREFTEKVPIAPEHVAQCIVGELHAQLEARMDVVETVPEEDYAAAVEIINQEKAKLGMEDVAIEPRKQLSLRQMFDRE
eukprot:754191-Hanusia_phi.AAC.15